MLEELRCQPLLPSPIGLSKGLLQSLLHKLPGGFFLGFRSLMRRRSGIGYMHSSWLICLVMTGWR